MVQHRSENNDTSQNRWQTIDYKEYPRLEKIPLHHKPKSADLFTTIEKRKSEYDFSGNAVTTEELSILLHFSCGITHTGSNGNPFRAQPSGGGLFPIEVYPMILKTTVGISSGLYHYNVKKHALEILLTEQWNGPILDTLFSYPWTHTASIIFLLTALLGRTQPKYGEQRAHKFSHIEAGHIAQNVYLAANALGLKCCALGGIHEKAIEDLLDIDGITESMVYAIAIGK